MFHEQHQCPLCAQPLASEPTWGQIQGSNSWGGHSTVSPPSTRPKQHVFMDASSVLCGGHSILSDTTGSECGGKTPSPTWHQKLSFHTRALVRLMRLKVIIVPRAPELHLS